MCCVCYLCAQADCLARKTPRTAALPLQRTPRKLPLLVKEEQVWEVQGKWYYLIRVPQITNMAGSPNKYNWTLLFFAFSFSQGIVVIRGLFLA